MQPLISTCTVYTCNLWQANLAYNYAIHSHISFSVRYILTWCLCQSAHAQKTASDTKCKSLACFASCSTMVRAEWNAKLCLRCIFSYNLQEMPEDWAFLKALEHQCWNPHVSLSDLCLARNALLCLLLPMNPMENFLTDTLQRISVIAIKP